MDFSNETLKKKYSKKSNSDCGILVGELFKSRDVAHLTHFQTTSFAEHKALNEYYDSLLDLVDSFVEESFGIYGRYKIVIPSSAEDSNFCKHLEQLRQSIVEHREYIHETNLQNLLDEILSLIDKTCYLLTLK